MRSAGQRIISVFAKIYITFGPFLHLVFGYDKQQHMTTTCNLPLLSALFPAPSVAQYLYTTHRHIKPIAVRFFGLLSGDFHPDSVLMMKRLSLYLLLKSPSNHICCEVLPLPQGVLFHITTDSGKGLRINNLIDSSPKYLLAYFIVPSSFET